MKKTYFSFFLLCIAFLTLQVNGQSYIKAKGVTFNIPGATSTYITCVNDSNDFGGYYILGSNAHGFYYDNSLMDTFYVNYPGAVNTWVYGINNHQTVVGAYNTTGTNTDNEAFTYNDFTATYEDISSSWISGMDITLGRDINDGGCIIGDYKQSTTHVCFWMCGGNNIPFHYNYNPTYISGLNNANKAVGFWIDGSLNNGLIRQADGSWVSLNYPGATRTRPNGINDSNFVVGTYNLTNSFLYKHGSFKEVRKDGTTDFQLQDINNTGLMVGYYKNTTGNYSGFYMPFCDIGFRPDTNGWKFQNSDANIWPEAWYNQFNYTNDPYLGWPRDFPKTQYNTPGGLVNDTIRRNRFPDWPLFVNTFGEENCYDNVFGIRFIKNSAVQKWKSIYGEWGGSCFGFCQSAFMAWDSLALFKQKYPNVGPWTVNNRLYELPINDHNRLCINQLMIKQFQKAFYRHLDNDIVIKPVESLKKVKKILLDNDKDEGGIVIINQNPGGGGHIVNPYKIEIDTINPKLEYIYIYDNNFPGDTTRRITVNKELNAWYYTLSVNAGVPADEWGGDHADSGMFVTWAASRFYKQPIVDSVKYTGIYNEKNNVLEVFNSTQSNILFNNQSGGSIGYVNNILINNIPGANAKFSFIGNQAPYGYILPEDNYNVEMKDFSDPLVNFSLFINENSYSYTRGNALISEKDNFSINQNGITFINNNNAVKTIYVQSITNDGVAEKTFTLSEMPLHSNSNITFSLMNNDKLKVVNEGIASRYHLYMQIIASYGVGSFEHDTIDIDANTTHIIAMDWMNIQNSALDIYVDNGNDGNNDDTLHFGNQGVAQIISDPANLLHNASVITDTVFIGNAGAGTMNWSVVSDAPGWLTINGSNTGSGFGFIKYSLTANTGATRTGHLTITATGASNSPYIIEVVQEGVLNAPTNMNASDGTFSDGVHLSWDALTGATHYKVYRSSIAGQNGTALTGWITATTYIDNTANGGDFYYYSVKGAQSSSGLNETAFSNIDDGWRDCFTANFNYIGQCQGQPTLFNDLSSVHTNVFYLWDIDNNGTIDYTDQNISHTFTSTGTKTVKLTVTDSSLCTNTITKTLTILAFPYVNLPDSTLLCGNQSVTLNAGSGFSSYLWSNGSTSSSTSIDSTGFGLGTFPVYVSVTNANGCSTIDTSIVTWYVCTDITTNHLNDFALNIYPNPSNDLLNVSIEGNITDLSIDMFNFKGQIVYSTVIAEINGHQNTVLDSKQFKQGIYFLRCVSDNKVVIKKLIIY